MKLGANPESGLMQLPMLNPVLHPSQRSASVEERGVAPLMLSLEIDEIKEFISSLYIEDRK